MSSRRERFVGWLVWAAGTAAIAATLLPFVRTDEWWVRILDFPRLQIAVVAGTCAILALLLLDRRRRHVKAFVILLLASLGYQAARIHAFTGLARVELPAASACRAEDRVSLLVANVLMTNRRSGRFLEMIRRLHPDLVLATEPDAWWDRQLRALAGSYPHAVRHPLDNTYGMILYSKLPLVDPAVRFLVQPRVPSIHAGVLLRSSALVEFHGIHPTPPRPSQDTTVRDVELLLVGRAARGDGQPTIVAGDLNDVGWSRTTRQFQEVSGLLDPRVGRGLFSTYNANWPLLRWPLDHVFVDPSFRLLRIAREGDMGSDHFPIFVQLCSTK